MNVPCLLAQAAESSGSMEWPRAFASVGIAFAIAWAACAFFKSMR